jgi:hypothetical protein
MTRFRISQGSADMLRRSRPLLGVALTLALTLFLGAPAAAAISKDTALSSEDKVCLDCHAKPGLRKQLANGESLPLYIAPNGFAESVHNSSGCEGCHSDIDVKAHSKEPKLVKSRREHSQGLMETCRDCHKKTMKQYEDSVHAAQVQAGSEKAPLCSDCHDPHATRSAKDTTGGDNVACQQCHKGVSQAFAASIHGASGDEALACKDCHRTHNIKAAAMGSQMKDQCVSCHREVATSHAQWLPNTARHLEAISCPACHSPGTTRRVNLRIYEGTAAAQQAAEKVGVPQFIKLANTADPKGSGIDGRALWSLLQDFSRNGSDTRTIVRGRLEVQTGIEAHSLAAKGQAVMDCATCHKQGAVSFQKVTVSMAGPDGRPLRHGATDGILNSIESIGSVGGFYTIGSSRIKLLDMMLVMALGAGILIPGGHLVVKLVSARKRKAAAAAEAAQASKSNESTDRS